MKVFGLADSVWLKVAECSQVIGKAWYEDEMCDIGGGVCHKALSPD